VGWFESLAMISRGLVAGSGTGHALARKWETRCCVQRCHWLFCSSGVPVACPQGATNSEVGHTPEVHNHTGSSIPACVSFLVTLCQPGCP